LLRGVKKHVVKHFLSVTKEVQLAYICTNQYPPVEALVLEFGNWVFKTKVY